MEGRVRNLIVHAEPATPGDLRRGGAVLDIRYGWFESLFGRALVAVTAHGVCYLGFGGPVARDGLVRRWPSARLVRDDAAIASVGPTIFPESRERAGPLAVHVRGTNFQLQVWNALVRVPLGASTSYGELARAVGRPTAARAVGQAVGANPIAWLIPCHRVLRGDGAVGGYAWGVERKRRMLAWEGVAG